MPGLSIYTRGYLPHWNVPGGSQFLTWRLYDALDPEEWEAWRQTYRSLEERKVLYRLAEKRLDEGHGSACLASARIGRIVMEEIFRHHGSAYVVHAAVVMPNHVHAVLEIAEGIDLKEVVKGIKGRSARDANLALGRRGRLWQPDYFDRLIRSPYHLERCVDYVHWNPVKAGLCYDPKRYTSSTANLVYAERTEVRGPIAG
jgi:REP element-mobilizing transposase RayT